ncbi:MAG: hypothetical protein ACOC85_00765 [Thermoplasmatota archaeon]
MDKAKESRDEGEYKEAYELAEVVKDNAINKVPELLSSEIKNAKENLKNVGKSKSKIKELIGLLREAKKLEQTGNLEDALYKLADFKEEVR